MVSNEQINVHIARQNETKCMYFRVITRHVCPKMTNVVDFVIKRKIIMNYKHRNRIKCKENFKKCIRLCVILRDVC